MRIYAVDLKEAVIQSPKEFDSFNAFFTRRLRPGTRPLAKGSNVIVSPCDGTVMQSGNIESGQLLQAKGQTYSASELLAGRADDLAGEPKRFVTIYLAPEDYHRVHAPANMVLAQTRYHSGRLLPVKPNLVEKTTRLFARNERLVFFGDTDFGRMFVVMVGALLVSGITTPWHTGVYRESLSEKFQQPLEFRRGDEIGRFDFGSTVILLLPESVQLSPAAEPGSGLRYGQQLAAGMQGN